MPSGPCITNGSLKLWEKPAHGLPNWNPPPIESMANLKRAIALRNRIIHGYDSVDDEIVYLTVTGDLEALKIGLAQLLTTRG